MGPIMELASRRNLVVIEDCAQVPMAQCGDKPVGTLGHTSMSAEIAILASDIVIGMDSTVLGEAMALDKPVFSNCMRDKSGKLQLVKWHRK